jgi:hypothetical protein
MVAVPQCLCLPPALMDNLQLEMAAWMMRIASSVSRLTVF